MKLKYTEFIKYTQSTVTYLDKNKVIIYCLIDPNTDDVRYIGKTIVPRFGHRMWQHYNNSKNYVGHWIQQLLHDNQMFNWVILDVVEHSEWSFWECWWIEIFNLWEQPLTNLTKGGDGVRPNEDVRKKMSEAQLRRSKRGDFKQEDYRKNLSISGKIAHQYKRDNNISVKHTEETKKKIGKTLSKIQLQSTSKFQDPEYAEARRQHTLKGWETRRRNKEKELTVK